MGFLHMNTLKVIVFMLTVHMVIALPVKKSPKKEKENESTNATLILEYERYLREVVEVLESDPDFRKKLDKAPEADIRNGKIAQELEYVNHTVRSKLDEIKRKEVYRLRNLASQQFELKNEIDREHLKITDHLDHKNEHTFEIEDLEKLILKAAQDIADADKKRHDEFKQYEMQKEFEKQSVLKDLDDQNKKKYEEEMKLKKEEHQKHEKVHHPGNKAQLEEVWEKQDHMDGQEFDPKSFFMMHDVDGNGVWDETELKALFIKELDKVYSSGTDDKRERAEEMERMREHVFSEIDTNRDGLVSYEEFLEQTKREEYQKDPEWETVDNVPQFTHDEYLEFEKKRQAEVEQLISQGLLPPHPNLPEGYYPKSEVLGQQYIDNNHISQMQHPQIHNDQVVNPSLGHNQQIPNQQINHNGPNPSFEHNQQGYNQQGYNQQGYNQQIPNQQMNHNGPNPSLGNNQQIPNQQINHNGPNPSIGHNQQGYNQQIPNQQVNHNGPNPSVGNNQQGYNQQIPNQQINHPNPSSGHNQQIPSQQINHNGPNPSLGHNQQAYNQQIPNQNINHNGPV